MKRSSIIAFVFGGLTLLPLSARADRRPNMATDAFYVGARVDPGAALVFAWDLDVYLLRNRALSIGPGVSLSLLGTPATQGRYQDLLVAADVLRFKVGVNSPGHEWRPFFLAGGGFSYARLPDQYDTGVTVVPSTDHHGMPTVGDVHYAALERFAPMLTFGGGVDLFFDGPVGVTLLWSNHISLSPIPRMPDVWMEVSLGIRFGP